MHTAHERRCYIWHHEEGESLISITLEAAAALTAERWRGGICQNVGKTTVSAQVTLLYPC